jgi:3-oxoacyl-[acyl-carrier protein] reductase
MDLGLRNRVAVVAAASAGLGKAVALELALEGANVIINARETQLLEATAAEIEKQSGSRVEAVSGDVTKADDVSRLIGRANEKYSRLDILITNAGGPPGGYFDDFGVDAYRAALELNLLSTVSLCKEAVPLMRKGQWGRIVAITSVTAKQPLENLILSNTARAGAHGFLKSLSQQLAADGITVNAVCPGYHFTERLQALAKLSAEREGKTIEEICERWAASTSMKRIGDPREFSAAVAFLCSDRASYITGTAVQVDGGAYRGLF